MHTNETLTPQAASPGPEIHCAELPVFDDSNWESVHEAFQAAQPCPLGQAWQSKLSSGFSPAEVRVGWREESLLVFAELMDADIYSQATGLNQRMWELGDTFEMFLRPEQQVAYVEFHVTPNNHRLQLRIPHIEALRCAQAADVFDAFLVPGEVFHSTTWLQPERQRWFVLAEIPAGVVCGQAVGLVGSRWRCSFSRYDYTRGSAGPVISSTSPHARPDFHSQQEWGTIQFNT